MKCEEQVFVFLRKPPSPNEGSENVKDSRIPNWMCNLYVRAPRLFRFHFIWMWCIITWL